MDNVPIEEIENDQLYAILSDESFELDVLDDGAKCSSNVEIASSNSAKRPRLEDTKSSGVTAACSTSVVNRLRTKEVCYIYSNSHISVFK